MKSLIIALALLSSVSAFAANNCEALKGSYSCNYQGQNLDLNVSVNGPAFKASIAGEDMEATLDGVARKASASDDVQKASCLKGSANIESSFKGELQSLVTLTKTAKGLEYVLVEKTGKSITLDCLKTK